MQFKKTTISAKEISRINPRDLIRKQYKIRARIIQVFMDELEKKDKAVSLENLKDLILPLVTINERLKRVNYDRIKKVIGRGGFNKFYMGGILFVSLRIELDNE